MISKFFIDFFLKKRFLGISLHQRKFLSLFFLDLIIGITCFILAFYTRYENYDFLNIRFYQVFGLYLLLQFSLIFYFKLYKYPLELQNFEKNFKICFLTFLIFSSAIYFKFDRGLVARSVPFIVFAYSCALMSIFRLLISNFRDHIFYKDINNIAIFGNDLNAKILKNLIDAKNDYKTKFFFYNIQDNDNNNVSFLDNIPVYSNYSLILELIKKEKIKKIYLSSQLANNKINNSIIKFINKNKITIEIAENIEQTINDNIFLSNEKLFYERIFEKNLFDYDISEQKKFFKNRKILITGGAGTIGNAIFNLLKKCTNSKIYVLDNSEIGIFLNQNNNRNNKIIYLLGSVNDYNYLDNVVYKEKFDYIFHTAAYKHVGIVQKNYLSAIRNNILGTENLLKLCIKYKIKNFIFISSDKAVNPKSIMGKTKRVGELLVKYYSKVNKNLNFACVRFGNVIGSSGSVIPIFIDRIKKSQDLIVKNKNVERYFMSSYEAAYLITKVACLKSRKVSGSIFIFDMGQPFKIIDIANKIIKLFNAESFVSIRVGKLNSEEKLTEKLNFSFENLEPTKYSKISIAVEKNKKYLQFYKDYIKLKKHYQTKIVKLKKTIYLINKCIG